MRRQGARLGDAVRRWWTQPDHFDWLCGYLSARGMATATRRSVAVVAVALAGMPFGMLSGQDRVQLAALTVCTTIVGVGAAIGWLRGWPSRTWSMVMITSGGFVSAATILAAEPVIALVSCNGLVVLCGYLAFFHSSRSVVCGVAATIVLAAFCAHRVAETFPGSPVALTGFWVTVEVTIVIPIAIGAVVRTLGADVVRSDRDALTGVLNRRAFYERAALMLTSPVSDQRLVVIMIDLDRFKSFNDTYGHVAGDQLLTAVGWALREANGANAIIGRVGGDEFLVVDCLPANRSESLPQRVCAAIAALPHSVTASVGAAIVPFAAVVEPMRTIRELVRIADAAMYQAKRGGGNRARASVTGARLP